MAKLNNKSIVHSEDACTMIFRGNRANPEPSTGIIKFPGGFVEVARCSDGSYYAHISAEKSENIIESRIDYNHEASQKHGIPEIQDQDSITKIAIKIKN